MPLDDGENWLDGAAWNKAVTELSRVSVYVAVNPENIMAKIEIIKIKKLFKVKLASIAVTCCNIHVNCDLFQIG